MKYVVEGALLAALLAVVAAITVIVIVSGADSLATTGLRDLALALAGGLAGVSMHNGKGSG